MIKLYPSSSQQRNNDLRHRFGVVENFFFKSVGILTQRLVVFH